VNESHSFFTTFSDSSAPGACIHPSVNCRARRPEAPDRSRLWLPEAGMPRRHRLLISRQVHWRIAEPAASGVTGRRANRLHLEWSAGRMPKTLLLLFIAGSLPRADGELVLLWNDL